MAPETSRATNSPGESLLPAGTPIDLDNCAREPIHIPGSVQPHGAMIVLDADELEVVQVSENVEMFSIGNGQ